MVQLGALADIGIGQPAAGNSWHPAAGPASRHNIGPARRPSNAQFRFPLSRVSAPTSSSGAPAAAGPAHAFYPGLPWPQRGWAMFTLLLGITLAVLDGSIANIALPSIARSMAVDPAASIWVINGFQLTVAICVLPFSSLGDIRGYRQVYCTGLVIFILGSLACALSPGLDWLIASRVLQGVGAAGLMSVNAALVRLIYPSDYLGRGLALNSLVVGTSIAIGPSIAALILTYASWPWLFAINVPACLLVLVTGWRSLPGSPLVAQRFDRVSAAMSALTAALLVLGIEALGVPALRLQGCLELGAALLFGVIVVRRQRGMPSPLVPVDLFASRPFSLAVATSFCSFLAQNVAFVALPFFLEEVLGRSQRDSGLLVTPWPAATAMMAAISGRLADRYPASILAGLGMVMFATGSAALALLGPSAGMLDVAWRTTLCGVGFGFFQAPNNRAMISAAPRERSGGASGVQAVTRQMAASVGSALVAVLFPAGAREWGAQRILGRRRGGFGRRIGQREQNVTFQNVNYGPDPPVAVSRDGAGRIHALSSAPNRQEIIMRWEDGRDSTNVEDRRGEDGGGGGGGGGGFGLPIGRGGIGLGTVAIALVAGWISASTRSPCWACSPVVTAARRSASRPRRRLRMRRATTVTPQFVTKILAGTEDVWTPVFQQGGGKYRPPKLVLYRQPTPTACGTGRPQPGRSIARTTRRSTST